MEGEGGGVWPSWWDVFLRKGRMRREAENGMEAEGIYVVWSAKMIMGSGLRRKKRQTEGDKVKGWEACLGHSVIRVMNDTSFPSIRADET